MQLKAARDSMEAKALFKKNMMRIRMLKTRLISNGISAAEHREIKGKLTRARKRVDEIMERCSNSPSTVKGD